MVLDMLCNSNLVLPEGLQVFHGVYWHPFACYFPVGHIVRPTPVCLATGFWLSIGTILGRGSGYAWNPL